MDDQQRAALKSRFADVHASFEQAEQSIDADDFDAAGQLLSALGRVGSLSSWKRCSPRQGQHPGSGRWTAG